MNEITELKNRLAKYLAGREGLLGAKIFPAWPGDAREFPLRCAAIAIGTSSVTVSPGGFGRYWGEQGEQPLVGNGALVTLRLDLYTPQNAGGGMLHELYEGLCAHLLAAASPFGLQKLWCGEPGWDRDACAYHMVAHATLRAALLGAGEAVQLREFELHMKGDGIK